MKRGTPDHWKMGDLARILKVPPRYAIPWANGTMERLWHYTGKYTPQGDIGRMSNQSIAAACCWPLKEADVLVDALVAVGFLDLNPRFRLLVHGWAEHADDSVKKTLGRNKLAFICPDFGGNFPSPLALASTLASKATACPDSGEEQPAAETPPDPKPPGTRGTLISGFRDYLLGRWEVDSNGVARIVNACRAVKQDITLDQLTFVASKVVKEDQRGPMLFERTMPAYIRNEVERERRYASG